MFENKSILEIKSLIKSKDVLAKEVVEFYLERIKKYNPVLNANEIESPVKMIGVALNIISPILAGCVPDNSICFQLPITTLNAYPANSGK